MPFSPDAPPKRAGDYTRFASQRAGVLPPSTGRIVAIPFTDDWGPLETPVLVQNFAEYVELFGSPLDPDAPSQGYVAVYNAFKGESDEFPGAGAVLCYRQGGAAAAKASRALAAGATNPAITITAAYEGERGNQYAIEVVANAANAGTQRDVRLYFGNTIIQEWKGIAAGGIVDLQTIINKMAKGAVVASGAVNGTILDLVAKTNLTGGNSGTALVAADWTSTRTALEPHPFGYFAPANLTDTSIQTANDTWVKGLNTAEKSKRFFGLKGGASAAGGETFATAVARSDAANWPDILNFGVGTYRDRALGLSLSTAQLVPRLAGILAARGGTAALTFAYMEDLEVEVGPTDAEILSALDQGVIVVGLGSAGVRFERGVTTYTDDTDEMPFETYSRIKYVTTMQNIERDARERNEAGNILGRLTVDDDTREFILGREQIALDEYVERKEIQNGAKVVLASDPPPSDDDEFIAVDYIGKFKRSFEQVRRTVYFS